AFDAISLILYALFGAIELIRVHQLSRTTESALLIVISALTLAIATGIALLARQRWMDAVTRVLTRWLVRIRPSADPTVLADAAARATEVWQKMRDGAWVKPALCSLLF